MNRRRFAVLGLAVALAGFATEGHAQRTAPRQPGEGMWQAERAFHLTQVMERARRQLNNTLLKVEIGTMAPIDVDGARQAVAQMDALIKADAVRTPAPIRTGPGIAEIRVKLAEMLNGLDLAEVKFDNGLGTTRSMFDGYLAVVNLLLS